MIEGPPLSPAERADIERQIAELKASPMFQAYPHLGFVPNPAQYRLLKSIKQGYAENKRIFIMPWANGTGKSAFWPNLLAYLCLRPELRVPGWFDFPPFNNWPYPKYARVVCDSKQLKEDTGALWKAMNEWWPHESRREYITRKQGNEWISMYKFPSTGWVVDLVTWDQSKIAHESQTIGICLMDEPPPEHVFNAYPSRFRKGGIIIMPATMLELDHDISYIEKVLDDPQTVWFHASDHESNCSKCARLMTDNGILLTGYLDHDELNRISEFHRVNNEDQWETRTKGILQRVRGKVFDFDTDIHTISREAVPKNLTTYMAVDPHAARHWFITVGGIDENGVWYILDEWPKTTYWTTQRCTMGLNDYAKMIEELETKWGCVQKIVDQKYASQNQRFDDCAMSLSEALLNKYGLYFEKGVTNPEVEGGGVNRIEDLLKIDRSQPVGDSNRPKLYVCSDLRNVTDSLRNLRRKRDPNGGYQNKLDPKYLDPARCVMYLVCHDTGYQGPSSMGAQSEPIHDQLADRLRSQGIEPPNELYEVSRI